MIAAGQTETREEMIARWEVEGRLVKDCPGCQERYESPRLPCDVHMPHHKPSPDCESGGRSHCTCSACGWD